MKRKTVWHLTYADIKSAPAALDEQRLLTVAANAIRNASSHKQWSHAVVESLRTHFLAELGDWAVGWNYSRIGGGPVHGWCCASHSVLCKGPNDDPLPTAHKAVAGLRNWHTHLHEAQALFAQHVPSRDDAAETMLDIYSAITHIVTFVAEATDAEDAWYGHVQTVTSWYLQSLHMPFKKAEKFTDSAFRGAFESWIAPSDEQIAHAAETLTDKVMPWFEQ